MRENLGRDVDAFLAQHEMTRDQVDSWIMHPGGPKVLEAVADALGCTMANCSYHGTHCSAWATCRRRRCW